MVWMGEAIAAICLQRGLTAEQADLVWIQLRNKRAPLTPGMATRDIDLAIEKLSDKCESCGWVGPGGPWHSCDGGVV